MTSEGAAIRYRSDIDGLRAVAVLPILLFHAGVQVFRGGFIGVDIFFVISGFLITGIITQEIGEGRFTIGAFYRRRFVRILPALGVTLLATLAFGIWFMLPPEIEELGHSIAAAAAFASNIFFYATIDYFGSGADSKPLLHTWSLGVEEQFYFFYPLLLIMVNRYAPRRLTAMLVAVAALSFALDLYQAFHDKPAGFYLLPGRAWELALGGLVAVGAYPRLTPLLRNLAALGGLALIGLGILGIKSDLPFPAPFALVPCVGSALLIAYGSEAWTGRLLSLQPMRWIGAISYSLYLWHWPLITFYRLRWGMTLDVADTIVLVAASVVAASLSYYLVEQPVLRRWRNGPAGRINTVALVSVAALAAASLGASATSRTVHPVSPVAERIAEAVGYNRTPEGKAQFRPGTCFAALRGDSYDYNRCLRLDARKPNVLVLGDSHAAQYWLAIAEANPQANVLQVTATGCRPVLEPRGEPRCTQLIAKVLATTAVSGRVQTVVLAGRWLEKEDERLGQTIRYLRGRGVRVVVIGPVVEYDGDFPLLLARALDRGTPRAVDAFRIDSRARDARIGEIARDNGAEFYSVQTRECPAGRCFLYARPGLPMHFDYGHLTLPAARFVVRDLHLAENLAPAR